MLALALALLAHGADAGRLAGATPAGTAALLAPVPPLLAGPPGDTALQRAESLLAAGRLVEARRIAEALHARRHDDPGVLTLLGRIFLAWPVFGRYQAQTFLERAARLEPANPEPLYYLGRVGIALGGDDGEAIARGGLVRMLALDPDYRDGWQLWQRLYRGDGERREAVRALAAHAGVWIADYRRAQLLVELREDDAAATLLDDVIRRRPDDPGPRAWLARALFQAGHDARGARAYEAALARAQDDSDAVLWHQVRGIASPAERAAYASVPPSARAAFFRRFWAQRTPSLSDSVNARLGEHFRRLVVAHHEFALLHPASRYFHSALFRALSGGAGLLPGPGIADAYAGAAQAGCAARLPGLRDALIQSGFAPRADSASGETANLEDGLDDRGRIFLRQGAPDARFIGPHGDSETWCYARPGGELRVSFLRRTGGYGTSGDMVVTPMMAGEAESAALLLAGDRADRPADLDFTFWPAAFRAADRDQTELILVPDAPAAAAALISDEGREVSRDSAAGRPLRLVATPGRYLLLLDARDRAGRAGRYRGAIALADFGTGEPTISSFLLAPGATMPDRDSLVAAAAPRLELAAGTPLRLYAELYDMGRAAGAARYRAEYRIERTDGSVVPGGRERATTIAFERQQPFAPRLVESLVLDPGRLPRGHYRLRLDVTDRIRAARVSSTTIEFTLR